MLIRKNYYFFFKLLKNLRKEMDNLAGDDADLDHIEHETDETKRSVKLMLKSK